MDFWTLDFYDLPLSILIPSRMVGAIIGRGGQTIHQIAEESQATIMIGKAESSGVENIYGGDALRILQISGNPENSSTACQKILAKIMQQTEAKVINEGEIPVYILACTTLIGRLIGANKATVRRIEEKTNAIIEVSKYTVLNGYNVEQVITVTGSIENICAAQQHISIKLGESHKNDLVLESHRMHQNASYPPTRRVPRPPPPCRMPYNALPHQHYMPKMYFPPPKKRLNIDTQITSSIYMSDLATNAIIVTDGNIIREIMIYSGATITVQQPNIDELSDYHQLRIVGTLEAQKKAQCKVFEAAYHINPRGSQLHVVILVCADYVKKIIGRDGRTVRKLRFETGASIILPDKDICLNNEEVAIYIIGGFKSTWAAQCRIRSIVSTCMIHWTPSPTRSAAKKSPTTI